MKIAFLLCAALLFSSITRAEQVACYPALKERVTLNSPDGWEIQNEGDGLLAHPKDDDSFLVLVMPLESTNEEVDKALTETKELLAEDYKDLAFEEPQKIEGDGVASLML